MLFHVSEASGIELFEPRPSKYVDDSVVWAIDAHHLRNYLFPRECPRVTYCAGPQTAIADQQRFLGTSAAVVAVESKWFDRLKACRLFCYHLAPDTFTCLDECAGYYVSREPVIPKQIDVFEDLFGELWRRGVELRIVPSLWSLRDSVVASTLQFSIIRMHNAQPRESYVTDD